MNDIYEEVFEKLTTLEWLLRRKKMSMYAKSGPCADPTSGQGRVLAFLRLQPEISTKDLSYLLGIRQQSLNELLNKLEKNGLVERKPSEEDKRVMIVHLTEKGKNTQAVESNYQDIFSVLNEEELKTFSEYLSRIIDSLEEKVGDDQDENWEEWVRAARSRMGEAQFDRLMQMKHRGFPGGFDYTAFACGKGGFAGRRHNGAN